MNHSGQIGILKAVFTQNARKHPTGQHMTRSSIRAPNGHHARILGSITHGCIADCDHAYASISTGNGGSPSEKRRAEMSFGDTATKGYDDVFKQSGLN